VPAVRVDFQSTFVQGFSLISYIAAFDFFYKRWPSSSYVFVMNLSSVFFLEILWDASEEFSVFSLPSFMLRVPTDVSW